MINDGENLVSGAEPRQRSCLTRRYFWLAIIRTLQLVLGFIALCLTDFVVHVFGGDYFHTFTLTMITFIWTVVIMSYIFVVPQWLPKYHNYWVQFILEVITVVLWLMSFSFLIWECQAWDGAQDAINDVFSQESEELNFVSALPNQDSAILGLRVATGLTCINWILFGVTLIMSTL